jgi:hypothetical protein
MNVSPRPAQAISRPQEIAENYQLILKYSDKARAVADRVNQLPEDLHNRFKTEAVSDPDRIDEIADVLLAEHSERLNPYGDPKLDAMYKALGRLGADAQAEFRRVLEVLKGQADPDSVFNQIAAESKWCDEQIREVKRVDLMQRIDITEYEWNGWRYGTKEVALAAVVSHLRDDGQIRGRTGTALRAEPKAAPEFVGRCPRCDSPRHWALAQCPTCGNTDPVPRPREPSNV